METSQIEDIGSIGKDPQLDSKNSVLPTIFKLGLKTNEFWDQNLKLNQTRARKFTFS